VRSRPRVLRDNDFEKSCQLLVDATIPRKTDNGNVAAQTFGKSASGAERGRDVNNALQDPSGGSIAPGNQEQYESRKLCQVTPKVIG